MWGLIAKFVFAETVGPSLNEVGKAIGTRLARKVDPEGAELEKLSVMAMAAQAGLLETEAPPEPEPKKRKKKT